MKIKQIKKIVLDTKFNIVIVILFCTLFTIIGYLKIGLPPVIIVGGSAVVGFFFWYFTYLKEPVDPQIILPLFVITVACLQIHIVEEYLTGFAPAMSRLYAISWSEKSFLLVFALVSPTIYTLVTLGLYYRVPIAGFVAWFIFIGPGVAEFSHFIFPLIQPAIAPNDLNTITQSINGVVVANMHNYYFKATGNYYFPGMYTAILPMIPGIYSIYKLTKLHLKK